MEYVMFFATCPTWDTTVMMSASSIVKLRNHDGETEAVLACPCHKHLTNVHVAHGALI
jgi:hypothetical protein